MPRSSVCLAQLDPAAGTFRKVAQPDRLRRVQDAGTGVNVQDIPFRFIPCMVAGLAYYIAMKKPDIDPQKRMELKADYEQQFQLAADEDREKASIRFVPRDLMMGR